MTTRNLPRAKILLRLASLGFFGFGLWGLFAPASMLEMVGAILNAPAARAEARAYYGGLELGFGMYLLYAARRDDFVAPAALAATSIFFGCFAARLVGMAVDGVATWPLILSAAGELAGGLTSLYAYRLGPRRAVSRWARVRENVSGWHRSKRRGRRPRR